MAHEMGWFYWAYCACGDPTTTGSGAKEALVLDPGRRPAGSNVERAKLRILAVPHPLRVAGTPRLYTYNRSRHILQVRWVPAKAGPLPGRFRRGAISTLVVPRIAYRHGYVAVASGADVVSGPDARILRVRQHARTPEVLVVVRPRRL
jgi:endoglycosylceramidase